MARLAFALFSAGPWRLRLPTRVNTAPSLGFCLRAASTTGLAVGEVPKVQKSSGRGRWTKEEEDLIIALRNEGKTWHEVRCRLPHRSLSALQSHIYDTLELRKRIKVRPVKPLTADEAARLQQLRKQGLSFRKIADCLTNRTEKDLEQMWYVLRSGDELRSASPRPYEPQEDAQILKMRDSMQQPWSAIAKALPGRTKNSISSRYSKLRPPATKPKIKHDKPATKVDEIGRMRARGMTWRAISATFGRGAYETYYNHRPRRKDLGSFTGEEDAIILESIAAGLSWNATAPRLPGRNAYALRIHYSRLREMERVSHDITDTKEDGARSVDVV